MYRSSRSKIFAVVLTAILVCLVLYINYNIEQNTLKRAIPSLSNMVNNIQDENDGISAEGSVTGNIFTGDVLREMPSITSENSNARPIIVNDNVAHCKKWAVVTTIFKASDAVSYLTTKAVWCLVVIADKKSVSKKEYVARIKSFDPSKHVYITVEEQEAMFPVLSKVTPYNSIARKNIGYAYAMLKGAQYIWDFDDDNKGIVDKDQLSRLHSEYVTPCKPLKNKVVNPYYYYGVNETYTWPRGMPLQLVRDPSTNPKLCLKNDTINIGVIQSLANNQPDVDAVYRLTRDTPFNFRAKIDTHKMFILPQGAFCPFNAQAALWSATTFKYLLLPISVNGRVSDIWRSYFAEFFFHLSGKIKVAYAPPFVEQDRNAHNHIKDFNAELDIYQKSQQLVKFLSSPETSKKYTTMRSLYTELYKRGYIELKDLHYISAWNTTLKAILSIK